MAAELVTIITPTGGRQEAFSLCEKFMARQTYQGPVQWIVVDDCNPPTKITQEQQYVRGPKQWAQGINTQRYNMDAALPLIEGNYVFIIEDDDWYAPHYIDRMVNLMQQGFEVVGEANNKYYDVRKPGFKAMQNYQHSSLCSTGIRKSAIPLLTQAVHSGELFFDIHLWRAANAKRAPTLLCQNANLCIGMKGLPGRAGIGVGHNQDYGLDRDYSKLKEWIGEDYKLYEKFVQKAQGTLKVNPLPVNRPANTLIQGKPNGMLRK